MRNRIDEVLKEQGKTYKGLVALTGLEELDIKSMANGYDRQKLGAWLSLARALHVSPAYLVGWSDEPSEDNIAEPDAFKTYVNNYLEPIPYYDFAKPKPTHGVKVTLDDGLVIYDSREMDDMDAYSLAGDWVDLNDCKIAKSHIVSIEKVGAES